MKTIVTKFNDVIKQNTKKYSFTWPSQYCKTPSLNPGNYERRKTFIIYKLKKKIKKFLINYHYSDIIKIHIRIKEIKIPNLIIFNLKLFSVCLIFKMFFSFESIIEFYIFTWKNYILLN